MTKRIVYRCSKFDLEEEDITIRGRKAKVRRVKNGAAVMIVPVVGNSIILEQQYRPVIKETIYEVPSGRIERGETRLGAARRELEEEIGYTAQRLKPLFDIYTDASLETQPTYCFVAEGLTKTRQKLDLDETIKPVKMSISRIKTLIRKNRMKESISLCAILYYLYTRKGY